MYELIAFYVLSGFSISCFSISVFSKNILHALSGLAGGMIFISGLYFLLGAEFLGVVQIVVYTGAVIVIYAFSMMFFDVSKNVSENISSFKSKLFVSLSTFISVILSMIFIAPILSQKIPQTNNATNIQQVGMLLFSKYFIVFELAALMLLVAMVAGIILVNKNLNRAKEAL